MRKISFRMERLNYACLEKIMSIRKDPINRVKPEPTCPTSGTCFEVQNLLDPMRYLMFDINPGTVKVLSALYLFKGIRG